MTSPYTLTLGPGCFEGTVDGVTVVWSAGAQSRLPNDSTATGVAVGTLKDVTEHFAVLVTKSLKNSKVKITGAPHDFTVESATGNRSDDDLHITITTSGPTRGGRHELHVYLTNEGAMGDATRFNNLHLAGQATVSVTKSGGKNNPDLSTSNYCENGTWPLPQ